MLKITMSYENETDKEKANEILEYINPTGTS